MANKVVINKWIKALRSGKYKQCHGKFKENGKYCVIGVLINLYEKENSYLYEKEYYDSLEEDQFSSEILEWAGLPIEPIKINRIPIGKYNDGDDNIERKNFTQLADMIEKEFIMNK